jgi:chaperonin cofactor prefoldin
MNDHLKRPPPKSGSSDELAARVQSLEARQERLADLIEALRQELHDGLSQQVVGVAMMAVHVAESLKAASAPQADKAEQLVAAIEDAKRQTFGVSERLKQMESELQG